MWGQMNNTLLREADLIKDIDAIVKLWYQVSLKCHDFVPAEYWRQAENDMRNIYLPNAETTVAEQDDNIIGFMSLVGNTVAAIFVVGSAQGQGVGSMLLKQAFIDHTALDLKVYKLNEQAVTFYKKHGFIIQSEQTDENTKQREYVMLWENKEIL